MKRYAHRGFTLIEMMIVLVIIAIIVAIAYPSYTEYMYKVRRSDGQAALMTMNAQLERCFSRYGSYVNAACPAFTLLSGAGYNSEEGFYNVQFEDAAGGPGGAPTATTFSLYATPQGAQVNDANCLTLTLNQIGVRAWTGSYVAPKSCW